MGVLCAAMMMASGALPVITSQPASATRTATASVTFTVAATGGPLTYQWQSSPNNSSWANIGGATSTSYTFTTSYSNNGTYYRCIVSNASGSTASNSALLTVNALLTAPALSSGTVMTPIADFSTYTGITLSASSTPTVTATRNGTPTAVTTVFTGGTTYRVDIAQSFTTLQNSGDTWVISATLTGATPTSATFTMSPTARTTTTTRQVIQQSNGTILTSPYNLSRTATSTPAYTVRGALSSGSQALITAITVSDGALPAGFTLNSATGYNNTISSKPIMASGKPTAVAGTPINFSITITYATTQTPVVSNTYSVTGSVIA